MKRNKGIITVIGLLCGSIMLCTQPISAYANSAQTQWEGVDSSGAIVTEENSPIIVEKEILTFDIQEFPSNHYNEVEEFLAYSGRVTAEYTFYNPADYSVTAKLRFPFGNAPDYVHIVDEDNLVYEWYPYNTDTEKYDITINGNAIEKTVRHTLTYPYAQFNLRKDMELLTDGYIEDEFYYPEQSVTKYTYQISGVDLGEYHAANVAFDVSADMKDTVVYFQEQSGGHTQKNGDMRISAWVEGNEQTITLYAIGKPFSHAPKWEFYENGGVEDKDKIAGKATLQNTETITFLDFALASWHEEIGVSQTDWYNAVIAEIKEDANHYNHPIVDLERYKQEYKGYLMRWYEYEIALEPEERIVNTVIAPIYPSINGRHEPAVYGYKYLLSPAKTWSEFGDLEIRINTPYFLIENSVEEFIKTDEGYSLKLDGLPENELEFILCSSKNPVYAIMPGRDYYPTGMIISIAAGVVLLSVGIIVYLKVRKRKKWDSTN